MKCLIIIALSGEVLLGAQWQKLLSVSAVPNQISSVAKPSRRQIGTIIEPNGNLLYCVVTESYTVQAAVQLHRQSSIIFLNKNRIVVAKYLVDLPEELPERVVDNALLFNDPNRAGKHSNRKQLISAELPKWICAGPDNCFHKQ